MKVLVAMSGGVDSAVAAFLLKQAGYDCIGVTMRLLPCAEENVADARTVADSVGIPFLAPDYTEIFHCRVIEPFIASYEKGDTPNPCILCNCRIKFGVLSELADSLGCEKIATGHYAVISKQNERFVLSKAVDDKKDQSYVLYGLTQTQLARTLFPLGGMTKADIRAIAEREGFVNAQKKDSQDICFVPDGDYARVIQEETGRTYPVGEFVTQDGRVLGTHKGMIHYTVGQRKGLGLALPEPMYVLRKDMDTNRVVLGRNDDLFSRDLDACDANWILPVEQEGRRVNAKIRYGHAAQPATVFPTGEGRFHLTFDEPQRAITAGQAAVLYDGRDVVGGGTIL